MTSLKTATGEGLTPNDFLELDRRFLPHDHARNDDPDLLWAEVLASHQEKRDWEWLLEHRVVALLAEAGSGKTYEFLAQTDRLNRMGRTAFFMRVERLCKGSMDQAFETLEQSRSYRRWLQNSGPAIFFLDSVDEAKLPHGATAEPLRDALVTLERNVGSNLHQIRLVISCRGSEWYRETEQNHVAASAERLRNASAKAGEEGDGDKLFRNLTFAPLDRQRVGLIAEDQGDADAFLAALDDQQLWDEVRTPMDAVHYATLFAEAKGDPDKQRQMASRMAVFDASVQRRLADHPDSRSRTDLRPDVAHAAARQLAFAAIVMQQRDLSFDAAIEGALDVVSLLSQGPAILTRTQVRQLLATPLFTPAGQGCVRFYRPEIEQMLAAQFLELQLDLVPARKMFAIFREQKFGFEFVPQPYGPTLAWLATRDQQILRSLVEISPEFLIEDGDPRALAIGDRLAAVERHVSQTCQNPSGGFFFRNADLTRFVEPELEADVVRLAEAGPKNEAHLHLLQMIRVGRFTSAEPWLEQLCGDPLTPTEARIYAIRALIACGTEDRLRRVAECLLAWGTPGQSAVDSDFAMRREDDARIQLIAASYPGAINLATMLRLLNQVRGREFSTDGDVFVALSLRTPLEELGELIEGLEALAWASQPRKLFRSNAPKQTQRADLLFDGLCSAIGRCIEQNPNSVRIESIDWCFSASRYSRLDRDREGWNSIVAALRESAGTRAGMIQAAVSADQGGHPLIGLQSCLCPIWNSDPTKLIEDINVALAGYRSAGKEERQVWTDLLARWLGPRSRSQHRVLCWRLGVAALRHRDGIDWSTLSVIRWRPFGWVSRLWQRYTHNDWWYIRHQAQRYFADLRERMDTFQTLLRDWNKLGEGKRPMLAAYLIFKDGFEPVALSELHNQRGRLLGSQIAKGTCRWVATIKPNINYRYEFRILHETGLQWLFSQDENFSGDLPEDARTAAIQHDLWESDESGPWVEALIRSDTGFWSRAAIELLITELGDRARYEPQHSNSPLLKLQRYPTDLQAMIAPALLSWAETCPTMATVDIAHLANVIETDASLNDQLTHLARRGTLLAFYEGQWNRGLAWLAVWGRSDPIALSEFIDWFEGVWVGDTALEHSALMALGSMLGGRWSDGKPQITELEPSLRLRLATLLHKVVDPKDDEPHRDGVQEVSPRRQREDVRRAVESYLGADHSEAGFQALATFVHSTIESQYPDWAQRWLASKAREAGAPQAWSIEQLRQFVREGTIQPEDGDALLAHVQQELADIEASLDSSEFDRRRLFDQGTYETDFRAWLGHELNQRIQKWAAITQETVTRDEKRTDLRIELRGGDHAVLTIEIKLAHRWDRDVLLDKVESQLVNQYLIGDPRIQHGIYLLVDLGFPIRGKMPDGTTPSAPELAELLSVRAGELSEEGGNQVRAQLFTVRCPPPRLARRRKR